jgi:hypothetical protein
MQKILLVSLSHILLFAPLLIYIGYKGDNDIEITRLEYRILLFVGIMSVLYHIFNLWKLRNILF